MHAIEPGLRIATLTAIHLMVLAAARTGHGGELRGVVVDEATDNPIAARLYVRGSDGKLHHVESAGGVAVPYSVRRSAGSYEIHTTLSAHPFEVNLPEGRYTLTAERGKEYFPATVEVEVSAEGPAHVALSMKAWTNMAAQGWFSGETHVHRRVSDLPTLLLAEDLNVALPLTAWVTDSRDSPATNNKNSEPVPPARLIEVDPTHVIWPINTEYEIFSVDGKRHTLGAVFVLNHHQQFSLAAPPVRAIAAEARRQGAFLDLDKHNWPWSIMLVPQMRVELFELANNHLWRTDFLFEDWYPEYVDPAMPVEMVEGCFTERGWIAFGFETYYAHLHRIKGGIRPGTNVK